MILPNRRFTRAILGRSLLFCVVIRLALGIVRSPSTPLSSPEAVFLIALTVGLVLFDARRAGEDLFLANLGVAPVTLALLAAGPPLALVLLVEGLFL